MSERQAIRVLALDLDGTVVAEGGKISDRVVAAVHAFRESGRKVLIVSGRARPATLAYAGRLGGVDGLVCFNGSAVYDGEAANSLAGGPFYDERLPEPAARRFVAFARGAGLHYHAFIGERWYYERLFPETESYLRLSGIEGLRVDFDEMPRLAFSKAMFVAAEERIDALAPAFREAMGDGGTAIRSGRRLLEFVPCGVSKAVGMEAWLSRNALSLASVLAFGDAENDLDMLLEAGVGVAMGNAPADLKERVGRVAAPIEQDGVAAWLEGILEEEGRPATSGSGRGR